MFQADEVFVSGDIRLEIVECHMVPRGVGVPNGINVVARITHGNHNSKLAVLSSYDLAQLIKQCGLKKELEATNR